jgi:hypothetical protein
MWSGTTSGARRERLPEVVTENGNQLFRHLPVAARVGMALVHRPVSQLLSMEFVRRACSEWVVYDGRHASKSWREFYEGPLS